MDQKSPINSSDTASGVAAHKKLVHEILLAIQDCGKFWKTNNGVARLETGEMIQFGMKGQPDIIGIEKGSGKFVGLEVKTGRGRLSEDQKKFGEMILKMGGKFKEVRSVKEAVSIFR